jgi:precorrin-8X/cobalt-precorrin-8 methylmutase
MIHTSADFDLLTHIRFHPEAVSAGLAALADVAVVATDTQMARVGIPLRRMEPLGCTVACLMNDAEVAARARESGRTRAFEAVDEMQRRYAPAVWAIGNAPTALLRLLELIGEGRAAPRLIVGMPVGFVNAAESKDLLAAQNAVPYITILGRKGGSALAACAVNALANLALDSRPK